MNKITLATLKSFVRKNQGKLFVKVQSSFDGMQDMVTETKDNFSPAVSDEWTERNGKHTLGFRGVWLVGQSRDYFTPIDVDGFTGIEGYNCCGSWIIAVKK